MGLSNATAFQLPFIRKEQQTSDVYSFFFDRSAYDFDFLPGQYIRMVLPHKDSDDRGSSRFFTIASSPLEKEHIMITTRIIKSTFKKTLADLSPGQLVNFWGPIGKFVLHPEKSPLVFLAGGIGLTPYHSMILYMVKMSIPVEIYLFVSFSLVEEMVFFDQLTQIANMHNNIKIIYTVTHPEESKKPWIGEKGRISEPLLKKYLSDIYKPTYYISGPEKMVNSTQKLLNSLNIIEDKIITEIFPGY